MQADPARDEVFIINYVEKNEKNKALGCLGFRGYRVYRVLGFKGLGFLSVEKG